MQIADAGRYVHEGFTGLSSRRLNFCTCSYVMRRGLADKAPLQAVAYAGKAQVQGLRSADTHTRTAGIGACRFIRRRLFFFQAAQADWNGLQPDVCVRGAHEFFPPHCGSSNSAATNRRKILHMPLGSLSD